MNTAVFQGNSYWAYLLVMVGVTYLIRAVPFVLVRKKVTNVYVRSFLAYIPYSVLAAMTFPAIIYSTNYLLSAVIGLIVACTMAFFDKGLVKVALGATITVIIVELMMKMIL